jgi:hypothetical protein
VPDPPTRPLIHPVVIPAVDLGSFAGQKFQCDENSLLSLLVSNPMMPGPDTNCSQPKPGGGYVSGILARTLFRQADGQRSIRYETRVRVCLFPKEEKTPVDQILKKNPIPLREPFGTRGRTRDNQRGQEEYCQESDSDMKLALGVALFRSHPNSFPLRIDQRRL